MGRLAIAMFVAVALAGSAAPAATTDPIKLTYLEGDYAGATTIWSEDGKRILGYVAYRQHRQGNRLKVERTAYFKDGSSDEDVAEAEVGDHLRALNSRSIIRNTRGKSVVDLRVDVAGKRVTGFYLDDGKKQTVDEELDIGPGTYIGPLYQFVVKNFAANAADGKVVVQSVVVTPKPRVIDMEFARDGDSTVTRAGGTIKAERITLLPTVNFLVDPILQRLVPKTEFLVDDGHPPSLVRFTGPRNYAGQMMRLE